MIMDVMNAAIADRDALNTRKREAVLAAIALVKPLVADEYWWQRRGRGCSDRAAERETREEFIDRAAADFAEALQNELMQVSIND
jgi:hypothetical protein